MHSLNAGLIIHRVGQVNYDYLAEARSFALDLQAYMNGKLGPDATTLVYEELLGEQGSDEFVALPTLPRTQNGKVLKSQLGLNVGIR